MQKFINNFATTLSATFGIADTLLQVTSAAGLPALSGGDFFYLTLFRLSGVQESGHEVVKVTAVTGTQLTVIRAIEGAAASQFLAGDKIEARVTALALEAKADVTETATALGLKANTASLAAVATSGLKADVGLGNVDNTSDANKPVSTAQATAIALKETAANKDATGGYAGLTLFKINFKNALNTFTSFFTNANTAARTYTFQDRDGTIADLGANSFTGHQTHNDNQIIGAMFKDCGNVFVDKGNSGTTAQVFDYTAGSEQKLTVTGAHTVTFTNFPPTGMAGGMKIQLVNPAAFVITWGTTINWIKSDRTTTTTFSSNGVTLLASGKMFAIIWYEDGAFYGKFL